MNEISYIKNGDRTFFAKVNNLHTSTKINDYDLDKNIEIFEDMDEEKFIRTYFM